MNKNLRPAAAPEVCEAALFHNRMRQIPYNRNPTTTNTADNRSKNKRMSVVNPFVYKSFFYLAFFHLEPTHA